MKKLLVLLVVLGLVGSAFGAETNFFDPQGTTGGTGDFDDAANWSLGHVPDYFSDDDTASLYGDATCDVYDTHYINRLTLGIGWWGCDATGNLNGQPQDYPNNTAPTGATLNIHPGAYLAILSGTLMGYADPNGTVQVNMTGGQFGDRVLLGTTSGWTSWGQDLTWNQTGGVAKFFVNKGGSNITYVGNYGDLELTYMVENKNATRPQEFVVRSHGVMKLAVTGAGGEQRFYIGVGGTLSVPTAQLAYVKANLRTDGDVAPTETVNGTYTELYVPEPATIALLGIGSLMMIRKSK